MIKAGCVCVRASERERAYEIVEIPFESIQKPVYMPNLTYTDVRILNFHVFPFCNNQKLIHDSLDKLVRRACRRDKHV